MDVDNPLARNSIAIVAALVAAVGVLIVRRLLPPERLRENNEFTGFTYAFAGLVYGVFLAYTIVIVWEHFEAADNDAAREASHLQELWRDVAPLPEAAAIRENIHRYCASVIDHEWPSMAAQRGADPRTNAIYDELWHRITNARVDTGSAMQAAMLSESVRQLNETGLARRKRLLSGDANVPGVMWRMLVIGGIGMILFTYLIAAKHGVVQILTTAFLALILSYSVLIVAALIHPYDGDVHVSPDAFRAVLQTIDTAH
jgi:hypothetical protein